MPVEERINFEEHVSYVIGLLPIAAPKRAPRD